MFSEKDFERLWFLYKTEGEPKGVSINSFCISNNIPYTAFYDWFKKTQKKVVPVEVEGIPEELIPEVLQIVKGLAHKFASVFIRICKQIIKFRPYLFDDFRRFLTVSSTVNLVYRNDGEYSIDNMA